MDETVDTVAYDVQGAVATVTMNRPRYRNAQHSVMTYALDRAFYRACSDDDVKVIVLAGAGDHFSGGHDLGTPERDTAVEYPRVAAMWWTHAGKEGADSRFAREQEVYLGMCRRWRGIPKPMIAKVQGACIAGGLMLAWICDLIIAAEDAYFADPVVRMGIPGVEWFAHPWVMGPRFAREFLYLGEQIDAGRALELGMVNRVVPRARLDEVTMSIATRIGEMPRLGLALTKKAINQAEDLMGMHSGIDAAFALHHVAHAHNVEISGDSVAGLDAHAMKERRLQAEASIASQ